MDVVVAAGKYETLVCVLFFFFFYYNHFLNYYIDNYSSHIYCCTLMLLTNFLTNSYDQTWGWNESKKRQELHEELARFIIVLEAGTRKPLAFTHFRFDIEDERETVYMYVCSLFSSSSFFLLSPPLFWSSASSFRFLLLLLLPCYVRLLIAVWLFAYFSFFVFARYELQLHHSVHKKGLGKFLVQVNFCSEVNTNKKK